MKQILKLLFLGALLPACASRGIAGPQAMEWRERMMPIAPRGYVCGFVSEPVKFDGNLEAGAWASAPWTADFVDIQGPAKPTPRFRTRAKMLWDENYLYVAAELEEPHVWATQTKHDSVIFLDPDFEVFMDPDGDTANYYEFEMNALNTTWDLRLDKPYLDGGFAHNEWEIPGMKSAVHVRGTLNDATDTDRGWTVEIAFPWKVLQEHARHEGPPNDGEEWRMDFSRVEWKIKTQGGKEEKVPNTPEDNWVWSPQGVVDMHRPEMWGLVQFTRQSTGSAGMTAAPLPGKAARDAALQVYYAQRDFWEAHHGWAANLAELHLDEGYFAGIEKPVIETTPDGYVCSASFKEGDKERVWRVRQDRLLKLDEPMPVESQIFTAQAGEKFGDAGLRAAWFLVDNMPPHDRATLSAEFLLEDVSLALQARKRFPWAKTLPERTFLNDVLPYASLDEPRDPWRAEFYKMAGDIVKDCKTATEATQALNREIFNRVNVHYNLKRKRNNQSPKESIEQGKATCTGLAIILVDACRAVGVPARVAGVPQWAQKDGNHTWTEIWDGEWYFTGADEYNKEGLNRAWFNGDAAITVRSPNPINQIYASSWRRTGEYFPLAWDPESREVAGVIVSARYAGLAPDTNAAAAAVHIRLRERENGDRLRASVEMRSAAGALLATNYTRAGTADMNDMADFELPEDASSVIFRFACNGQTREKSVACAMCMKTHTLDFAWNDLTPVAGAETDIEAWLARPPGERGNLPKEPLSRAEAGRASAMAWAVLRQERAASASNELAAKAITIGENKLVWMEKTFGDAPSGRHSLWITLHGGGQATPEENDLNWRGYYGRYEFPPGSINVAPRAPANSWDMWFVKWTDGLFDRLIADMVIERGVDPDHVYLIGYSAGGDGVYQLAPRMADRFAAATMCAGHPNQVTGEGLRNLPFFLYMGGEDTAYHRNTVVREFGAKLDAYQALDPSGYVHRVTVYPGLAHNMQGREAETIPRMAALERVDWPKRVVWKQEGDARHTRFYWLERPAELLQPGEIYAANVEGQTINIEAPATGKLTLRLSDELLDLDKPVRVVMSGRTLFEGKVPRSFAAIEQSLGEREDPRLVATALLPVSW